MKRMRLALAAFLTAATVSPAPAYVLWQEELGGQLVPVRWRPESLPIPFVLNDQPLSLLLNVAPNSPISRVVQDTMAAWEVAPIGMRLNGTVATQDLDWDGVNLITFADTKKNRDISVNAVALCARWTAVQGDRVRIVDTDVVWNPKMLLATDARADRADLQKILTHELGHALGLDHTALIGAAMYPFARPGETSKRTPTFDDLAGIRQLYSGTPDPMAGTVTGTVVTEAGLPVYGAHVIALDADGIARLSTLTERDGNFTITALPAGDYWVYAEPVNGPAQFSNLPKRFQSRATPALKAFLVAFAGGNRAPTTVSVVAGQTAALAPIQVEARTPALKVEDWLWSWTGGDPWHHWRGIGLSPGRGGYMAVMGPGVKSVPDSGFSFSGRDVTIDYSRARRNNSTDNPWVAFPVSVSYTAKPGARTLFVAGNTERAALSGVIDVTPR